MSTIRRSSLLTAVALALGIAVACRPTAPNAQEPAGASLRVATYNLEWFSEDANPERIANLKSVVGAVDAHIWGLQEVQSQKAAQQVWGDGWQIAMLDDPDEHQELALAVRKPYTLGEFKTVFPDPSQDPAFPGKRDVLRGVVTGPDGFAATVYVVHLKSRRGGRVQTDIQRREALGLLAAHIVGRSEPNVIVMGDMNDAPDDQSVNVLETGNLLVEGGRNDAPRFMYNLAEELYDKDMVSYGLERLFEGKELAPIVAGAKEDNERLRGRDYQFPQDVKVTQILFDQILVSPSLNGKWTRSSVYSGVDALRGEGGRTTVTDSGVVYEQKGSQASDHLPVVAEFSVGS